LIILLRYQITIKITFIFLYVVSRLITRAENNLISVNDHAIRHRVVKSHRLIVAWPCFSFTATMRRSSTEYQRLCVLARIDNTRRSSRAETNPSSYGTSIDTFRSSATSGSLVTSLAAGPSRGSQPPETWKPGTGKTGRDTRRWISSDTHVRALSRCSFMLSILQDLINFFTLKTLSENLKITGSRQRIVEVIKMD